jgi:hypothetical protein
MPPLKTHERPAAFQAVQIRANIPTDPKRRRGASQLHRNRVLDAGTARLIAFPAAMHAPEKPAHEAAAGSLLRPAVPPPPVRRLQLAAELALLFVAMPLALDYAVHTLRVPIFLLLPPLLAAVLLYLLLDRSFSIRREFSRGFSLGTLGSIMVLFAVAASAIAAYVRIAEPDNFLAFPRHAPELWLRVMLFYPLLSALAQELLFRTFFFHRYGAFFSGQPWLLIAVNGALFGFGHVVFGSTISVILSSILGLLLAWRYTVTRSIWATFLEHTLYGWLVFTIGLGRYFFTGVSGF